MVYIKLDARYSQCILNTGCEGQDAECSERDTVAQPHPIGLGNLSQTHQPDWAEKEIALITLTF